MGRRDPQKREGQACSPAQLHNETPNDPNLTPRQAPGQLRRAAQLEAQADRLADLGEWPAARKLRHEARQLRRLAQGPRPEAPLVDIERQLAAGQLRRWAGRAA